MADYEVYYDQELRHFRVRGLASRRDGDQLLVHHIPYPETETPEIERAEGKEKMHSALYDMYQWHEGLKEGDRFITPFGNFRCVSFHVVEDLPCGCGGPATHRHYGLLCCGGSMCCNEANQ